ncbi:unnamed protein product, partial [Iphiclides podalirius]
MVFTKLADWEQEYTIFVKLTDMQRMEMVRDRLREYRAVTRDALATASHAALMRQGFTYDDRNVPPLQTVRGRAVGGMSYTQKANKRKYCERLARSSILFPFT